MKIYTDDVKALIYDKIGLLMRLAAIHNEDTFTDEYLRGRAAGYQRAVYMAIEELKYMLEVIEKCDNDDEARRRDEEAVEKGWREGIRIAMQNAYDRNKSDIEEAFSKTLY